MAIIEVDDSKISELGKVLGKNEKEVIDILSLEVSKKINEKITAYKRKKLYDDYKVQLIALKYQGE